MSLRKFTVSFDETIRVGGIGLALFFMFQYLVYVNAKSLYFLIGSEGYFNLYFAVIGSMAYSSTTIAVMRRKGHRKMKIALPLFDSCLVLFGYNLNLLEEIANGDFNPMRFGLTLFFALFTGFITYGLGMLNFEERTTANEIGDTDRIISELERNNAELSRNLEETLRKLNETERYYAESTHINGELSAKQKETLLFAEGFLVNHVLFESWRSKKKSPSNRNGYEAAVDRLAEQIKTGKKVSLQDWFDTVESIKKN